ARWHRALAAEHTTANRLRREVAEAFTRYQAARIQVERLTVEVLPRQAEGAALVLRGYQAGAAQVTFADVLQAEQALTQPRPRPRPGAGRRRPPGVDAAGRRRGRRPGTLTLRGPRLILILRHTASAGYEPRPCTLEVDPVRSARALCLAVLAALAFILGGRSL